MQIAIKNNMGAVAELCRQYRVLELYLFGSATGTDSSAEPHDLDFIVEFESMEPSDYADCYFGLLDALFSLFGHEIDLVELKAVRNPYFLETILAERIILYAA